MAKTKIEWAMYSWNPVTGCSPVSEGCINCYARRMAYRLAHIEGSGYGSGIDSPNPKGAFNVQIRPERLDQPLRWKKPRRIFVCSMSDLFHPNVPTKFIDQILEIIDYCDQHTFMILTKRPENIHEKLYGVTEDNPHRFLGGGDYLPNLWLGVTAENQQRADERIPILLQIPAAVHWVSCEPLLGDIDLRPYLRYRCTDCGEWIEPDEAHNLLDRKVHTVTAIDSNGEPYPDPCGPVKWLGLDWVICGAEVAPKARPMDEKWVKDLRDQCVNANVPFFYKQKVENGKKIILPELEGKRWAEFPQITV